MNIQGTSGDTDADHAIEHRHFSGGLPRLLHAGWGEALARLQQCQSQGHVPGQIQAWLDVADLHLGVGSLGRAQQALVQAQQLHRMDQRRAVSAAGPSSASDVSPSPHVSSLASPVPGDHPSADLAAWSLILHAEILLLAGRGARDGLAGPMVGAVQLAARALAQWPDAVWACGSLSRWPQARASAATSHALLSLQCGADAAQGWAGLAHSEAQGASAAGPWQQLRRTLAEAMRDSAQGGPLSVEAWPPAVNALLAAIAPDWRWVALATQGLMISEWPHGRTWAGPWRSPMARWLHQLGPELEQSEPAWPLPPVPAHAGPGAQGEGPSVATLDELSSLLEPWLEEWAADWLVWWPADGLSGARWDALSRRWRAVAQDAHSRALAAQARPQSVWSLHCLEQAPLAEDTRRQLLAGAPQASALAIGLAHGTAGWRGLLWVGRDRWTLWHPTQAASAGAWLAQALGPAPAAAPALSLQPAGAQASWPEPSRPLEPRGTEPLPGGQASAWPEALRDRLQRAESLATLGSLVGGFAHDLNSPLGVILTSASLLEERAAQVRDELEQGRLKRSSFQEFLDAAAQSCQLMLRGTERASRLVRHFKQLAVEALDEHRVPQPLAGAADDVAVLLREALAGRGHRLEILGEWEGRYDGPPGALSQVLLQLVRNASEHAGLAAGAPIVLQARRERGREGGPGVCIEVRDQGRGMTPAEREAALSRPFSKDPDAAGGMGLFLAHELVTRALGGELQVGEGPQGGLLVQLWLPWQPD